MVRPHRARKIRRGSEIGYGLPVRNWQVARVLVLALLWLVSCGPSSPLPAPTPVPTSAAPSAPVALLTNCSLVTAADVSSTLAIPVGPPLIDRSHPPVTSCLFQGGTPTRTVLVVFHPDEDAAAFANDKATLNANRLPTTDIPGLGDQAYASLLQSPDKKVSVVTLVARKGMVQVSIRSQTTLDPAFQLMQLILARL